MSKPKRDKETPIPSGKLETAVDFVAPAADAPAATPTAPAAAVPSAAEPTPTAPAGPSRPSVDELEKLIGGDTHDPHGLLGAHPQADGSTVIRTLRHQAKSVTVLTEGREL